MSRGFAVVSAYLDKNISLPQRKTQNSAGYDLEAASDLVIAPRSQVFVATGLKAYMAEGEVLFIYPRSSLFQKKQLIMTNSVGVIDADYFDNPDNEGHILISLYNLKDEPVTIKKGERIAQAIFSKYLLVDGDNRAGNHRFGGFGSTD
ncbi:MAG: dUTP diphosphatase [Candidatus Izemoplasmatales bacterium]|jgi:dUTP pyrophosphatase